VPRELEVKLKREAQRRRVTVSHLVRTLLEDTVALVDSVLDSVDDIVADSVDLAGQVASDALRVARSAALGSGRIVDAVRGEGTAPASLDRVDAWNSVIMNRATHCARCEDGIPRGASAYVGLGVGPTVWLCERCIGKV
jgi:hypothetical protein